MDKIVWDDSYSVGVQVLDDQHKELIKMINKLIDGRDVSTNSEVISETLSSMTKYMYYHFRTEENYMLDSDYPDYAIHKRQHDEFMEKTIDFCEDTIIRKESVPAELLAFLTDWLMHHILKSDMQYKPHLNSQGIN